MMLNNTSFFVQTRTLCTSAIRGANYSNLDERKLFWGNVNLRNKRHLRKHKKELNGHFEGPNKYNFPIYRYGTRSTGLRHHGSWEHVPEKVPELIVPDLTGFKLKPYVSYRAKEVIQEKLTSKDLFNAIYGTKIVNDFKAGKINLETGESLEPSEAEKMTADQAYIKARQTGSDIFQGGVPIELKWRLKYKK